MKKKLPFRLLAALVFLAVCYQSVYAQKVKPDVRHIKVYYEKGRYAGWPANNGIWIWGNEILTGFARGYHQDNGNNHNIDRSKVVEVVLSRSKDGGETWMMEDPAKKGLFSYTSFGLQRTDIPTPIITQLATKINFKHPDLAFTLRLGKDNHSTFSYSYNRGVDWKGPYALPEFDTPGTMARTDYIIDSENEAMAFLTVQKKNGKEGRVMCIKTTDGGKNWAFVSWIGEEPTGYSIMPASVRLSRSEILVTVRVKEGDASHIASYFSADNGKSWIYRGKAVEDTGVGNPPAMVKMKDGRICLIYGYRSDPDSGKTSDIRARLSSDQGKTWGQDYVLRDDGAGRDIGYPRVVQRPDGKIVSVYYFTDKETGPERYIGASIWTPPAP